MLQSCVASEKLGCTVGKQPCCSWKYSVITPSVMGEPVGIDINGVVLHIILKAQKALFTSLWQTVENSMHYFLNSSIYHQHQQWRAILPVSCHSCPVICRHIYWSPKWEAEWFSKQEWEYWGFWNIFWEKKSLEKYRYINTCLNCKKNCHSSHAGCQNIMPFTVFQCNKVNIWTQNRIRGCFPARYGQISMCPLEHDLEVER